jgi:hypothetical protein
MEHLLKKLALELKTKDPKPLDMVIGFDGFVDEIIQVVDKRQDSHHFTRIQTIGQLAKRIENASGLSTNIELVVKVKKIGGNGPIMCNALSKHQSHITYIGALGYPQIHEVFEELKSSARLISIAESGHTDALEFLDGKLMLGKMTSLSDVNYDNLLNSISLNDVVDLLSQADLLAMVNWSMLPNMTDLWKKMIAEVLPNVPICSKKPLLFIDLADPEKREHHEIKEVIDLLKSFNTHYRVVLGLNKKEAYDIASVLGLFPSEMFDKMTLHLKDICESIYAYCGIHGIVIHPVERSCAMIENQYHELLGPLCKEPKLTTGAGDNFNSGFVLGLLLDMDPSSSLLMGMATSGFYVRNAKSPHFEELINFIDLWAIHQID